MSGLPVTADLTLRFAADRAGRVRPVGPDAPVTCSGQLMALPPGRYDWLHLRTDAPAPRRATVWLYYRNGVDPEHWDIPAGDGAFSRIPVPRRDDLLAIGLPDDPAVVGRAVCVVESREDAP
ncbi:hypothetical protein QLQ12_30690 [Actinoplanes sp. NEAU-A12]|uniref:Uncharacterized protein n=1 Tax=Actinoplanes sandaracinus TaxID=3045177 RepID=A0ABT6WTE4_9ACTN|nr:hypothetical protein [Actinoplanes sandaracinus]MDI6102990.1 hypothetical protein [Actinoplanes sandaracinus]